MIRSELVARIAAQNPHLYAKDVEAVVNAILDRITVARRAGPVSGAGIAGATGFGRGVKLSTSPMGSGLGV
jgi:hypothetical protein